MLARANRIARAEDFRRVSRTGRKTADRGLVVSVVSRDGEADAGAARFGFITSKEIGSAPVRNRLRRRMRAAAYVLVREGLSSVDVVVRATPGSASLEVVEIEKVLRSAVAQGGMTKQVGS